MAKLTKADRALRYQNWIQIGQKHISLISEEWDRFENYLETPHFDEGVRESLLDDHKKSFGLPYNAIWNIIKNLTPLLVYGEPIPIVTPTRERPNVDRSARFLELAMRHFSTSNDLFLELEMCVQDALVYNVGYLKQGYFVDFGRDDKKTNRGPQQILREEIEKDTEAEKIAEKVLSSIEDHDDSAELSLDEVPGTETWWGERVDPKDILVPPTARYKLDKAPWLIHRIVKPVYDTMQLFPETARLNPTALMELGTEGTENYIAIDAFEIFEIWDKTNPENKKVAYVVGSQTDKGEVDYRLLKEIPWIDGIKGFPFTRISFNVSPKKYWLPPDLYFYEHFAQALSEIMSNQLGATRRERRHIGFNPEKTRREQVEKIAYGPDGDIFEADDVNAVWEHKTNTKQLDFSFHNLIERKINQSSGLDEFYQSSSSRVESATEASYIKQGSQIRIDSMIQRVERFMDEIYSKMGGIIQALLSGPLAVKISQSMMKEFGKNTPWVELTSEDIQGDFLYKIKSGTLSRESDEVQKRKFFDFYNLAYQDPYIQPIELRRLLIEKYFDRKINPEDLLISGMAGQTEQAIMLEHKLAMLGQPIPSPNMQEEHESHIKAHTEFMENPPDEIKAQMAQLQNMQGSIPTDPATGEPSKESTNLFNKQVQSVKQKWEGIMQIVQAHIEETQQLLQQSAQPLNYNMANENPRSEQPKQARQAETQVALG